MAALGAGAFTALAGAEGADAAGAEGAGALVAGGAALAALGAGAFTALAALGAGAPLIADANRVIALDTSSKIRPVKLSLKLNCFINSFN